jgi:hypothetical protein
MTKRGSRPAPPFDYVSYRAIAAANSDDDGDGACCAGDGVDHAKKLDWMFATDHCWRLKKQTNATAKWFDARRQEEQVPPRVERDSKYVSRYISQGSEIPRGDIETQESYNVAMDSFDERINKPEGVNEAREGKPGTRRGACLALAGAGQGSYPPNLRVSSH